MRDPLPSPEDAARVPAAGGHGFNRLVHESSPYLLQHARNPVDWRPWGQAAFDEARALDRPVFLSVGYSTCHWCHVMAEESFQRTDVAEILNALYVPVKVDREERPDVDDTYMTVTQMLTGSGGWPNSVWLAPDKRPWFAGTYFPREDMAGRPGFKTILLSMADIWRTRREDVERQADEIARALRQMGKPGQPLSYGRGAAAQAVKDLRAGFDADHGGFGGAPKFPPHGALALLLYLSRRDGDAELLSMAVTTLRGMAAGGMRDHLGGGFHRYSTDERWLLPHFEKMLYDNAQLARAYAEAFALGCDPDFATVAAGICDWALREMRGPEGGFCSALDADSEGGEGRFYVWRRDEVLEVLGRDDGELFCRAYGVTPEGNFRDEATRRLTGANVLHMPETMANVALREAVSEPVLAARLAAMRARLLVRRDQRPRPHKDDKRLASWNGLALGALAFCGKALGRPAYLDAARQAAEFCLSRMRLDGRLMRAWRAGQARVKGYLDDYALLADGLLDLAEAAGEDRWSAEAGGLLTEARRLFSAEDGGGFYLSARDHDDVLTRMKPAFDQAVPSGNGAMARVAARLFARTGRREFLRLALDTVAACGDVINRAPLAATALVLAQEMALDAADALDAGATSGAGLAPLSVELTGVPARVSPGQTFVVTLRACVAPGWRINTDQPVDGRLAPSRVELEPGFPGRLVAAAFPAGQGALEGRSDIVCQVAVNRDAPLGQADLALALLAQPCRQGACAREETWVVRAPLIIR